jgi:hypothetical protein
VFVWITLVQVAKEKCWQLTISRWSASGSQLLWSLVVIIMLSGSQASWPVPVELSWASKEIIFTETRTQDSFSWLWAYSCYLSVETNSFGLEPLLVSCLVSEPPSPGIELRTLFPEFGSSYVLFLMPRSKHSKFGANQFIPSRAISEHTYKHTYNFIF